MDKKNDCSSSFPMEKLSPIPRRQDDGAGKDEHERIESTDIFNSPPPSPSSRSFRIEEVNSPPAPLPTPSTERKPSDLSKVAQFRSAATLLLSSTVIGKGRGTPRGRRLKTVSHHKFTPIASLNLTTRTKNQPTPGCSTVNPVESRSKIVSFESPKRVHVDIDRDDNNEVVPIVQIDDAPSPPKRQHPVCSTEFQSHFDGPKITEVSLSDHEEPQEPVPVIEGSPAAPLIISLRIRQDSSSPEPVVESAPSEPSIHKFDTPAKHSDSLKDDSKIDINSFETPIKDSTPFKDDDGEIAVFQSPSEPDSSQDENDAAPQPPPQPKRDDPEGTLFQESELPRRIPNSGLSELLKRANRVAERVKRDKILFEYETSTGLRTEEKGTASPPLVILSLWKSGSCYFALCQPQNLQRFRQNASQKIVLVLSKQIKHVAPGALISVHFPVSIISIAAYSFPFCLTGDKIRIIGTNPLDPFVTDCLSRNDVINGDSLDWPRDVCFTLRPKNSPEPFYFDSVAELRVCQLLLHGFDIGLSVVHSSSTHSIYCVDANERVIRIDLNYRTSFPDGCNIALNGFHVKDMISLDSNLKRFILGRETDEKLLYILESDGDRGHSIEMVIGALLPPRKTVTTVYEAFLKEQDGLRHLVEVEGVTLKENDRFEVKGDTAGDVTFEMVCHSIDAKEELLLSAGNVGKIILDGVFFKYGGLVIDDLAIIR